MPDEEDSETELEGFAEMMRANKRGASDYWYWGDRPQMEVGAAKEVLTKAGVVFRDLRTHKNDPPDCEATIEGQLVGIEVTELIHEGR
jgi:hypothetical protein